MLETIKQVLITHHAMTAAELSIRSQIPAGLLQPMLDRLRAKQYVAIEEARPCAGCDLSCSVCDKMVLYRLCKDKWPTVIE